MLTRLLADTFSRGHVIGEDDGEAEIVLGGGRRTAAGERVTEETAMRVAAVYACVSLIAGSIRQMPLRVRQDVGDEVLRDDRESRLWGLLSERPNGEMHANDLWEWVAKCLLHRGNGFLWLERDRLGRVSGLWPLHPRRVHVRRDLITRRKYFEVSAADELERVEYFGTTDEILQIPGFDYNGLVGKSVIGAQRETIGRALKEDRHTSETLRNQARPGGILRVKGRLDDPAAERLKARWNATHGQGKSGGTAVLEEDTQWESVTMNATDLQLVEQRMTSREDVAMAFFPDLVTQVGKKANLHYSSDQTVDLRLVKYGVMPWANRIHSGLEICDMLPWRYGMSVGRRVARFDPNGLLQADIKTRREAAKLGIEAGWLDPNTVRREENLEPVDGLDKPTPLVVIPAESQR